MSLLHLRLIGLVLVLASLFGAYTWVRHDAVADYKVELAIEQAEADKAQQDKYNTLAADYETLRSTRQANAQTITRTYEKIIEKPVYLNVCLDNSGVQLANEAIAGKPASVSNDKVPSDPAP